MHTLRGRPRISRATREISTSLSAESFFFLSSLLTHIFLVITCRNVCNWQTRRRRRLSDSLKIFSLFFCFRFIIIAKKEVTTNQCDPNTLRSFHFIYWIFHPARRKNFRNFYEQNLLELVRLCFFAQSAHVVHVFKSSYSRWWWVYSNIYKYTCVLVCANWNITEISCRRAGQVDQTSTQFSNPSQVFLLIFSGFLFAEWVKWSATDFRNFSL